ncbi:MAG: hypothetical protein O7G13_17180 [Alphaproteobacteria bacterium]|nr:hypothetical protein [Alphaproteobacteria bacterium]MCZ6512161.1 hypothetical protein [Alphaproteobacteria bacterium]MCZ6588694.1 hypothetical protein [Alphaproteobacteria bacterium]MCZ6593231.1 hypothetical protein [Alphaproteobacteria bacterium]MCZ6840995.1 hypothetical protein [Alphaproteobacteria bacterium]
MASLSKRTIETLNDLVEIKLSCIQVFDRDDAREMAVLESARRELAALLPGQKGQTVVPFPDADDSVPARATG